MRSRQNLRSRRTHRAAYLRPSSPCSSPTGADRAFCSRDVVIRMPCCLALQRIPAHITLLVLCRPPAQCPCARRRIRPANAVVADFGPSRRFFGAQPRRVTIRYGWENQGFEANCEGQRCTTERQGACGQCRCRSRRRRYRWCSRACPCPLHPFAPASKEKSKARRGETHKRSCFAAVAFCRHAPRPWQMTSPHALPHALRHP